MARGILSRNLANRIGKAWEELKVDIYVHPWLRAMEIDEWQKRFDATIPELRNLLEFARSRSGGVAVDVITKGIATIDIEVMTSEVPSSDARLALLNENELSPIGIWVEENLVGRIASRDQADILGLLSSGLMVLAKCEIISGKGKLGIKPS